MKYKYILSLASLVSLMAVLCMGLFTPASAVPINDSDSTSTLAGDARLDVTFERQADGSGWWVLRQAWYVVPFNATTPSWGRNSDGRIGTNNWWRIRQVDFATVYSFARNLDVSDGANGVVDNNDYKVNSRCVYVDLNADYYTHDPVGTYSNRGLNVSECHA